MTTELQVKGENLRLLTTVKSNVRLSSQHSVYSVQQRACLFDQTACAKQFCAMVLRGILSPFVS